MRKQFFYIVLAIAAITISACTKGDYPANIQGNWEYNDTTGQVIATISTSSSSAPKGIPAQVDYTSPTESLSTKVLIDYDPQDGEGTFKPEKGTEGLQGEFSAIDQERIKVTLILVDKKGESVTLLKKEIFTAKKDVLHE